MKRVRVTTLAVVMLYATFNVAIVRTQEAGAANSAYERPVVEESSFAELEQSSTADLEIARLLVAVVVLLGLITVMFLLIKQRGPKQGKGTHKS